MATTAPRTGLSRPDYGDSRWDDDIQAWLDKLDATGAFADLELSWTAKQTFLVTQSFATIEATRVEATRVVATVGELSSVEATSVAATASVQAGTVAATDITTTTFSLGNTIPADTALYVLPVAASDTAQTPGDVGHKIDITAQAGQGSIHVAGQGGNGGLVQIAAGAGGYGVDGGDGGSIYLLGGTKGSGSSTDGVDGNIYATAAAINLSGVLRLVDPYGSPTVQSVTVTSDNFEVVPTRAVIRITSNDSTASNRTFYLQTASVLTIGQIVVLVWSSGVNKGELDLTKHKTAGTAWPSANPDYDTITLLNADGSEWMEIARSVNS